MFPSPFPMYSYHLTDFWLTDFCSISQTCSLSPIPTFIFPPTRSVGISSQQGLLSTLLSSQPNSVAEVVFLKQEGDDITFLLIYFHWIPSCRADLLVSSARPAMLSFPGFTIVPLQASQTGVTVSSVFVLQYAVPILSDHASHSASNNLPVFNSLSKGFALFKALRKYFFHKGISAFLHACVDTHHYFICTS